MAFVRRANLVSDLIKRYSCSNCGFKQSVSYLPRVYRLPSGSEFSMIQVHTWCSLCQCITVVESLEVLPEDLAFSSEMKSFYQQQIEDCSKSNKERTELEARIVEIDTYDQQRLEFLVELRAVRTAERRCLVCGNTDIELPNTKHGEFTHRPCPGKLSAPFVVAGGVLDPRYCETPHVHDADGVLLERGSRHTPKGSALLPLWSDCPEPS